MGQHPADPRLSACVHYHELFGWYSRGMRIGLRFFFSLSRACRHQDLMSGLFWLYLGFSVQVLELRVSGVGAVSIERAPQTSRRCRSTKSSKG
jgi:hypothetical protein